jgi:hypothetical protein
MCSKGISSTLIKKNKRMVNVDLFDKKEWRT